MARVLVVEDSSDLAFGVIKNLEIEGHEARLAEDGGTALALYDEYHPDVIILDLMLPVINGYRVLQTLRERGSSIPVLIVSATTEEAAKIRGFRLGADDFVTKPFSTLELMARVEALLRRAAVSARPAASGDAQDHVRFADVEVDMVTRTVHRKGARVELSPKAFDVMMALIKRRGAIVRRQELLREVWGHIGSVSTRTIDAHLVELRRKLEDDPANPCHFVTVRKKGYRFQW